MGAERDRGDTDGGEGRGGDRPHPILQEGNDATGHGDTGQDRDNPVGESAVKSIDEMMSFCLVPTRAFNSSRDWLVRQFSAALGAVDHYEWHFVPEGSVLVAYDDKPSLLADEDYVELYAVGGS